MKLRIEIIDTLPESEVIIRCSRIDDSIQKLQSLIQSMSSPRMKFYKGAHEYYLPLEEILFFETEGEEIHAHTAKDSYRVKHKLYELEEMLPRGFVRAAKGTIVNTSRIYSINRNLTSSSQIEFTGSHKHIYVSRHYYKTLREKMDERSV